MRNPENVLRSLSEKAQIKGYRYERLYRNLYNPEFYLLAYQNIAKSQGSMTPGADGMTLDGMSMARIERIIAALKDHSYQPNPARRTYIEKKNSTKKRPLGIPSTDDKLIQEVVRMILEAIYEPTFSENSHGFRPNRSCHTALKEISTTFTGAKWIIEGDIKACFDSFDHHVLIDLLRRRIQDEYFISLMWKFLRAGYMEQWEYHTTYSGTPQGSGVSPVLANIYLHELDVYMAEHKAQFDVGNNTAGRKRHEDHDKVRWAFRVAKKQLEADRSPNNVKKFKIARKIMLSTPVNPVIDPSYKRIQYNRYADDFLIGVVGSKEDAERIKTDVKRFLQENLKLTMSEEKTKITHSSEMVRYLGYDVTVSRSQDVKRSPKGLQRFWYGKVQLYVPHEKWVAKLHEYNAFKIVKDETGAEIWKPLHRGILMHRSEADIISKYNSEIRGLYNYYRLAINVSVLGKFYGIMRKSCMKTFAAKYNTSVKKIYDKYTEDDVFGAYYWTKAGRKRCELYHDGFKRNKNEAPPFADTMPQFRHYVKPTSLAGRLKSGTCELCTETAGRIYMHHVRKLKDLTGTSPSEMLMKQKRRKSLALCGNCYEKVQQGLA